MTLTVETLAALLDDWKLGEIPSEELAARLLPQLGAGAPAVPSEELLKRLQNVRLAFGGATVARHENGAYVRELPDDEWDALCDALKSVEHGLRGSLAPARSGPTNDDRWYIPVGNGCLVTSEGRTSLQLATPEEAVVVRDALNARLAVPGERDGEPE